MLNQTVDNYQVINLFAKYMSCLELITNNMDQVYWRSGRFFNKLGQYDLCIQNESMKYTQFIFGNTTTQAPNRLFLGGCVPSACSIHDLKQLIDGILAPNQTYVYNAIDYPQKYEYPYDWVFYFTVTILCILVLLLILASLFPKVQKLKSFRISESIKIFEYKNNPLNVFNGLKSLCMLWVILGHEYQVRISNTSNLITVDNQMQSPFFLLVAGGFFAVDVFFFVGGLLVAYSFLRAEAKSLMKYPLAIVHRLLRFWPSYIMVILIFYSVFLHTNSGPFWWSLESGIVPPCSRMWKPLLFVDNLVDNGQTMCMGWGWYLQNDMQIYAFSLIILYVYSLNKMASIGLSIALILGSNIYVFYQTYVNEYVHVTHMADWLKWGQFFTNIYIKPWARCPPYIYGLILGFFYVDYMKAEKLVKDKASTENNSFYGKLKQFMVQKKIAKYAMQLIGLFIVLFIIVIPRVLQLGYTWSQFGHSIYLTFTPLFLSMGVSLIILPSLLGLPSMVMFVLDTKFFNFMSKVSFWTYLIHYMTLLWTDYGEKVDFYYSTYGILPAYSFHVVFSIFLAILGTLLIEVPFSKLEKKLFDVIMPQKKKHHPKEKQQQQNSQSIITEDLSQSLINKTGDKIAN